MRLEITNDTTNVVTWKIWVLNNDTLGNPSAQPIVLDGGTIPFDTWTTFVVMLIPDYTGDGQIKVWENGTQVIAWIGKVGYDPSTIVISAKKKAKASGWKMMAREQDDESGMGKLAVHSSAQVAQRGPQAVQ